jgi:hypothetical protein
MPVSNIELLDNTLGRAFQYPRAFSLFLGVFAGARSFSRPFTV